MLQYKNNANNATSFEKIKTSLPQKSRYQKPSFITHHKHICLKFYAVRKEIKLSFRNTKNAMVKIGVHRKNFILFCFNKVLCRNSLSI